jgi:hypothetical protein
MPSDDNERSDGDGFDVVLVHSKTADGEGARVLRARPGRLEAGEVRPMREGQSLTPGGDVVRLVRRTEAAAPVYDVHVEYQVPAAPETAAEAKSGPAQVATHAYRESWERTFGPRKHDRTLN